MEASICIKSTEIRVISAFFSDIFIICATVSSKTKKVNKNYSLSLFT